MQVCHGCCWLATAIVRYATLSPPWTSVRTLAVAVDYSVSFHFVWSPAMVSHFWETTEIPFFLRRNCFWSWHALWSTVETVSYKLLFAVLDKQLVGVHMRPSELGATGCTHAHAIASITHLLVSTGLFEHPGSRTTSGVSLHEGPERLVFATYGPGWHLQPWYFRNCSPMSMESNVLKGSSRQHVSTLYNF